MPCLLPKHCPASHSLSFGHCLEVRPFNTYCDNYCRSGTGRFLFIVVQAASSPKETVLVPFPTSQATIAKTGYRYIDIYIFHRWDRRRHGIWSPGHLVVHLLHRVFCRGEWVVPKVLWENPTGWLSSSSAPENAFTQLMYRMPRKCHLETGYSKDRDFSQLKLSLHSTPREAVQNTMIMPWQIWLEDNFWSWVC